MRAALERFEGPLVSYASRLLRDDVHRARDVVQETFLRLCSEDPVQLDGRLAPWLYTVCRRLSVDALRKETRMATPGEAVLDARVGREADPALFAESRDDAVAAMAAVAALPADQREVLDLRIRGGLRYREIAEVTGHPLGTVSWLVHEGLRAVRKRLGASGGAR